MMLMRLKPYHLREIRQVDRWVLPLRQIPEGVALPSATLQRTFGDHSWSSRAYTSSVSGRIQGSGVHVDLLLLRASNKWVLTVSWTGSVRLENINVTTCVPGVRPIHQPAGIVKQTSLIEKLLNIILIMEPAGGLFPYGNSIEMSVTYGLS